ncbi:MAG TPA: tetratricopeptide repeat protein [Abditibacteriaceae bacterium]|jgi:tetratricopeptide (TPR) repeat protein
MDRGFLLSRFQHFAAASILISLSMFAAGCDWSVKSREVAVSRGTASPSVSASSPRSNVIEYSKARQNADSLWAQQRYLEAEDWYRKVVRDDPRDATAHYRLGWIVQHYLLQTGQAAILYKKAIVLNPRLADAYCALGDIAFGMKGDLSEAEKQYRKALSLREDALFRMQLATVLLASGRRAAALQQAQRAVAGGYSKPNPTLEKLGIQPAIPTPQPRPNDFTPRGYST